MLTPRENFMETIRGGKPERFVKQYEFMQLLEDPVFNSAYGDCAPGTEWVNGWGITYGWPEGTLIVPQSQVTFSVGIITALQGLAMGLTTYFASALMGIFKTGSLTAIFPVLAVISVLGIIYAVIYSIRSRKAKSA